MRKIGATNGACEQHIANKGALDFGAIEHHMPRRVSGCVAHGERAVANANRIAIVQPSRGREGLGLGKAKHLALLGQTVDPELVARMRADDG